MSNSFRNPTVIILVVLGLSILSIVVATQQLAQASIFGDYEEGRSDGKSAARNDYNSGNSYDSSCPRPGISYCAGYKLGYSGVWGDLSDANSN
jgi:hypothetical protein